jgi:hypothetical protein
MLKTVSSVANALGALNYKGTWNASTNTPTLASGVGTQGDYYVVSVAGTTDLDGITNWGVGDWAAFNGSVWQRVEGGADGNFVNLDVTGIATFEKSVIVTGGITGHGANRTTLSQEGGGAGYWQSYGADAATKGLFVLRQASSDFSVNNIPLAIFPSGGANFGGYVDAGAGNVRIANGNLVIGTSGAGIDFSATAGTGTSELLDDYEEGVWSAALIDGSSNPATMGNATCYYTKVGRQVTISGYIWTTSLASATGSLYISGLPFAPANITNNWSAGTVGYGTSLNLTAGTSLSLRLGPTLSTLYLEAWTATTGAVSMTSTQWTPVGEIMFNMSYLSI